MDTLIPATCEYSVTCDDQQMSLSFNNQLYGTAGTAGEFGTDTCDPTYDAATSTWTWSKDLGSCSQTISRTGSGTS